MEDKPSSVSLIDIITATKGFKEPVNPEKVHRLVQHPTFHVFNETMTSVQNRTADSLREQGQLEKDAERVGQLSDELTKEGYTPNEITAAVVVLRNQTSQTKGKAS